MSFKKFLVGNFLIILFLVILTEPALKFFHKGFLSNYENYIELPFLLLLSSLVSALIIGLKKELFNSWLNKFLVWYFPAVLFIIFLFPTSGYVLPHRYDMAVLFGAIMVFVTVGFVGYSFYKNRKVN